MILATHKYSLLCPYKVWYYIVGPPATTPLRYSNYDEQQYDELRNLLEVINTKDTPILLGDLNHSPASPGINWCLPFHYGLLNARGLVSPYVLEDGRCTFCSENLILDHIYIETNSYRGRVLSTQVTC